MPHDPPASASATSPVPASARSPAPAPGTPTPIGDADRRLDERLVELEIKFAFAEDLLDTLNALLAQQAERIEALGREVVRLKSRVDNGDSAGGASARDERPPHY